MAVPPLPLSWRRHAALGWRLALAYTLFLVGGQLALYGTLVSYHGAPTSSSEPFVYVILVLWPLAAMTGIAVSLTRVRVLVMAVIVTGVLVLTTQVAPAVDEDALVAFVGGVFAFGAGFLAMQRTGELYAAFPPSVGWVGAMIVILNEENRVRVWDDSKVAAWLVVPLILLALFIAALLWFLAEKQRYQLALWRVAGGTDPTWKVRAGHRAGAPLASTLAAVVVLGMLVFGFSAVVAPYLWHTGPGRSRSEPTTLDDSDPPSQLLSDPDAVVEEVLRRMREVGRDSASLLPWILLFVLLFRPLQRAAHIASLRATYPGRTPSGLIADQWTYLTIATDDVPGALVATSADEVRTVVEDRLGESADLTRLSEAYDRARYGVAVQPDDPESAYLAAGRLFAQMRSRLPWWRRIASWYRVLRRP